MASLTGSKILSTLAMCSLFLSACEAPRNETPIPPTATSQPTQARVTNPEAPPQEVNSLAANNNAFGFDLYQSLKGQEGNLFFSPFSISLALAMTYAGARGDTAAQMASALHFDLPQESLHPAFNALDQELAKRGEPTTEDGQPMQLDIANGVWAQQDYPFQQAYLDLIASHYSAGIRLADFVSQSEPVRKEINAWVSERTNEKIKDLIPEGALDALTRMVLVNAIYFKADWEKQFDPILTTEAPFHLIDGSDVTVSMMTAEHYDLLYTRGNDYQAIELPYQGGTSGMDIILPDEGKFEAVEASLNAQSVDDIRAAMQPVPAILRLPKFKFSSGFNLSAQLGELGMRDAFDPDRADFSGMTGMRDLFISEVIHKAFVAVDEEGTEAAAATAVVLRASAVQQFDFELTIDRPFIFIIRDLPSGQILFIGCVLNPTLGD